MEPKAPTHRANSRCRHSRQARTKGAISALGDLPDPRRLKASPENTERKCTPQSHAPLYATQLLSAAIDSRINRDAKGRPLSYIDRTVSFPAHCVAEATYLAASKELEISRGTPEAGRRDRTCPLFPSLEEPPCPQDPATPSSVRDRRACAGGVPGRNGAKVRVYEQAKEFQRIGAGIQMSPNAMRVLRALGLEARLRDSPSSRRPGATACGTRRAPGDLDLRRRCGDALWRALPADAPRRPACGAVLGRAARS